MGRLITAYARNPAMGFLPIIPWSGAIVDIPTGWALCDGTGQIDLMNYFVYGASRPIDDSDNVVGTTGGRNSAELIPHQHALIGSVSYEASHGHGNFTITTVADSLDDDWGVLGVATPTAIHHTHDVAASSVDSAGSSHTHANVGGPGLNADTWTYDTRPPYVALAYIKALTPTDIPVGSVAIYDGDPTLLPAGYFICDYNFALSLDYSFVIGAGDKWTLEQYTNGDSIHWNAHVHTSQDSVTSSDTHLHHMGAASALSPFQSATYSNPLAISPGNFPASQQDPHSHGLEGITDLSGSHSHTLDADVSDGFNYMGVGLGFYGSGIHSIVKPVYKAVYYVKRAA